MSRDYKWIKLLSRIENENLHKKFSMRHFCIYMLSRRRKIDFPVIHDDDIWFNSRGLRQGDKLFGTCGYSGDLNVLGCYTEVSYNLSPMKPSYIGPSVYFETVPNVVSVCIGNFGDHSKDEAIRCFRSEMSEIKENINELHFYYVSNEKALRAEAAKAIDFKRRLTEKTMRNIASFEES